MFTNTTIATALEKNWLHILHPFFARAKEELKIGVSQNAQEEISQVWPLDRTTLRH